MSDDGGMSWGPRFNITNTHTPYAAADSCKDETDPTLALKVDDYLHLFYILDTDAGPTTVEMGDISYCPVIYQKVPTNAVPGPEDCYITFEWIYEGRYFPWALGPAGSDTGFVISVEWYLHSPYAHQVIVAFSDDNGNTFTDVDTVPADSTDIYFELPEVEPDYPIYHAKFRATYSVPIQPGILIFFIWAGLNSRLTAGLLIPFSFLT